MGCAQTIPNEVDHHNSCLTPAMLSSNDLLEIPENFTKWFPSGHAHKKIRTLFKWNAKIGHSALCSVYEVEYKGQIYAIKQISKSNEWSETLFLTECRVLSKIKHENIIPFIDMFFDDAYYYILIGKADHDLHHMMREKRYLSEQVTKSIIRSLLKAIDYLHYKNISHRDVKPENIVFTADQPYKSVLIDFGDVTMVQHNKIYTELVGSPFYMSPERFREHKGFELIKSDIWAVAVIAFEMYSGKTCFDGETQKEIYDKILLGEWEWPTDRIPSNNMKDFVQICLQKNAKDRPSANTLLSHEWFGNLQSYSMLHDIKVNESVSTISDI